MVAALAARYAKKARGAFHTITPADLIAVGHTAVLEAFVRYREGDTSRDNDGGGFASWARTVVTWRIGGAVREALETEPSRGQRADSGNGVLRGWATAAPLADALYYEEEMRAWLLYRLRHLSTRRAIIVAAVMKGETQASVARTLGLSPGRVHQEYQRALSELRAWAAEDGFDGIDLDA